MKRPLRIYNRHSGCSLDFFENTPKDVLPQMWPLFKKYQIGESIIPKKYREMMMLASAAANKCPYCQTYHIGYTLSGLLVSRTVSK